MELGWNINLWMFIECVSEWVESNGLLHLCTKQRSTGWLANRVLSWVLGWSNYGKNTWIQSLRSASPLYFCTVIATLLIKKTEKLTLGCWKCRNTTCCTGSQDLFVIPVHQFGSTRPWLPGIAWWTILEYTRHKIIPLKVSEYAIFKDGSRSVRNADQQARCIFFTLWHYFDHFAKAFPIGWSAQWINSDPQFISKW